MNYFSSSFSPGETVVGTVLSLEPTGALINIGTQTPAYLPLQEISIACIETPEEVLKLNETRQFWIITSGEQQGQNQFILSLRHLEEKLAWERLRQMKAENATVYTKVVATSTDEVFVDIEGLRGSIYDNELVTNKPIEELIGEILPLKIRYADEDGKSLNLSHNQALVARQIKQLKLGEVVVGTVRHIKHFGVFVDKHLHKIN